MVRVEVVRLVSGAKLRTLLEQFEQEGFATTGIAHIPGEGLGFLLVTLSDFKTIAAQQANPETPEVTAPVEVAAPAAGIEAPIVQAQVTGTVEFSGGKNPTSPAVIEFGKPNGASGLPDPQIIPAAQV